MNAQHTQFVDWWVIDAGATAQATARKCNEYGSGDLYGIGHAIGKITNRTLDDDAAFELGVLFYVLGKIERAVSAAKRGERASDDTWLDLSVYANMVRSHRAGVWPQEDNT